MSPRVKLILLIIGLAAASALATRQQLLSSNAQTITSSSSPIQRRVQVLEFNPQISLTGQKLSTYKGWNEPTNLEREYISTVNTISSGLLQYQIVNRQVINSFPVKNDGFTYTEQSYLTCISNPSTCHADTAQGLSVNYQKILSDYQICAKVNSDQIDELWLWGGPYFSYWEASMAGSDAYLTNGAVLTDTTCSKPLHIMGYSYERYSSEMIHNLGHRSEGTLMRMFNSPRIGLGSPINLNNLYHKFAATNSLAPNQSGCGYIHSAPNSTSEEHSSYTMIANKCDDWYNYPNFQGTTTQLNCTAWNCNQSDFVNWWFKHLPHTSGISNGKLNNWWMYITDYPQAQSCYTNPTCYSNSNSAPTINNITISSPTVKTDGTTTYVVRIQSSDADGYANIGNVYFCVNNPAVTTPDSTRGCFNWTRNASWGWSPNVTNAITCTGGGKVAEFTGRPTTWADVTACTHAVSGSTVSIETFTIKFATAFVSPSANRLYGYVADNSSAVTGWIAGGTFTLVVPSPTPTPIPTATPIPAFWQAEGGSVVTTGAIACILPQSTSKLLVTGTNNKEATVISGTADMTLGAGGVSTTGWNISSALDLSGGNFLSSTVVAKYDYNYFSNRVTAYTNPTAWPANSVAPAAFLAFLDTAVPTAGDGFKYTSVGALTVEAGNLNLGARKVVILATGDVTFRGQVNVTANQGLLIVLTSGNVIVDPGVGSVTYGASPHVEGVFIANDFNTGVSTTRYLRVEGVVVAFNKVNLQRNVAGTLNPAEYFVYRPEMVMRLPKAFLRQGSVWSEVAP